MAFFKRTIAKRFDLLFRRKRRGKFVECVHKVIEARRSGCIDEDGNILKPLTEMLAAQEKLKHTQGGNSNGPVGSASEEALKVETRNTHRPLARQQVVSIRDSYPLPEEDDGSEGYASAGETDDSFVFESVTAWNEFQKSLRHFYEVGELCDVTLKVG